MADRRDEQIVDWTTKQEAVWHILLNPSQTKDKKQVSCS